MKEKYEQRNREIIDFYYQKKPVIERVKSQITGVLMYLKKEVKIIERFGDLSEKVFPVENTVLYTSEVTLLGNRKTFFVRFKIKVQEPQLAGYGASARSFADGNIAIQSSLVSKKVLCDLLHQQITALLQGVMSEELFLNNFLYPLQKKFSHEIIRVHYAGSNNDRTRGIDFVVEYKPPDLTQSFDINFNLKSSSNYIEKHKARYPKVSTFIFKEKYLYNRSRLTNKFFAFLKEVIANEVAHF